MREDIFLPFSIYGENISKYALQLSNEELGFEIGIIAIK
jgi:hypothetical protein